jgi:uncharacterized protein YbjT (DUF2867 family)
VSAEDIAPLHREAGRDDAEAGRDIVACRPEAGRFQA